MTDLEKLKKTFDEIGVEYEEQQKYFNDENKVAITLEISDSDPYYFEFLNGKFFTSY